MHIITCFLLIFLTSCGFHPALQQESGADGLQNIKIGDIKIVSGDSERQLAWKFSEVLEKELYKGHSPIPSPLYLLNTKISYDKQPSYIQKDSTIVRYNIRAKLDYQLLNITNNKVITSGSIFTTTSMDSDVSPLTNVIADRGSRQIALENIASSLRHNLYKYVQPVIL